MCGVVNIKMLRISQCFIYIHYTLSIYRFTWVCWGWKHSTLDLATKYQTDLLSILSYPDLSHFLLLKFMLTSLHISTPRSHKPVGVEMLPLKSYECFTLRHTQIERVCVAPYVSPWNEHDRFGKSFRISQSYVVIAAINN